MRGTISTRASRPLTPPRGCATTSSGPPLGGSTTLMATAIWFVHARRWKSRIVRGHRFAREEVMAASRPRHLIMSAALVVLGLSATAFAWKVTNQLKGHPAPPIALKTIDDKSLTIPGPRGRVVLVDYWATWCGPCRESLPHLQKLADDKSLAERGLVVLA